MGFFSNPVDDTLDKLGEYVVYLGGRSKLLSERYRLENFSEQKKSEIRARLNCIEYVLKDSLREFDAVKEYIDSH